MPILSYCTSISHFYGTLLQKGNWADRVCEEKHGFICMKMSAANPTGDEVEQDQGCKSVRLVIFYLYILRKQISPYFAQIP